MPHTMTGNGFSYAYDERTQRCSRENTSHASVKVASETLMGLVNTDGWA